MMNEQGVRSSPNSEHDPLCPLSDSDKWDWWQCMCEFIAKVRADERERAIARVIALTGHNWPVLHAISGEYSDE